MNKSLTLHSTVIALSAIDMHSGAGLVCQAIQSHPLPYKISFLLSQTETKIAYSIVQNKEDLMLKIHL